MHINWTYINKMSMHYTHIPYVCIWYAHIFLPSLGVIVFNDDLHITPGMLKAEVMQQVYVLLFERLFTVLMRTDYNMRPRFILRWIKSSKLLGTALVILSILLIKKRTIGYAAIRRTSTGSHQSNFTWRPPFLRYTFKFIFCRFDVNYYFCIEFLHSFFWGVQFTESKHWFR